MKVVLKTHSLSLKSLKKDITGNTVFQQQETRKKQQVTTYSFSFPKCNLTLRVTKCSVSCHGVSWTKHQSKIKGSSHQSKQFRQIIPEGKSTSKSRWSRSHPRQFNFAIFSDRHTFTLRSPVKSLKSICKVFLPPVSFSELSGLVLTYQQNTLKPNTKKKPDSTQWFQKSHDSHEYTS